MTVDITDAGMLIAVKTAIAVFLSSGAQSYSVNGRTFQRAQLKELLAVRDDLERRIAIAAGKGRNYAKFVNADG